MLICLKIALILVKRIDKIPLLIRIFSAPNTYILFTLFSYVNKYRILEKNSHSKQTDNIGKTHSLGKKHEMIFLFNNIQDQS